jgi:hypothetical protein
MSEVGHQYTKHLTTRQSKRTFWLEIAVDKSHQMQILKRSDDLGSVKAGAILWQTLSRPSLQRTEEFAPHTILHAKVEVFVRLK